MIPVTGFEDQTVAVLGMGRSGLATARALEAGGAAVVVWDDTPQTRERAEAEGFTVRDLRDPSAFEDIASLIVSPGIPHLYPQPNAAVAAALEAGVPVDNDIGLFFRSLATDEWDGFDRAPRVVAVTGSNGKSTTSALIDHVLRASGRDCQLAGNIGRGALDIDPPGDGGIVV
ncbi:NAD(P)-dependent oxidoreductase, partial [Citreimonas sp.]|uniref:NAD(P)-dependent oxidoreductase n=1 Tax=Citreimonas sp. TaxID=3036715 RepID=UPI0035C7980B